MAGTVLFILGVLFIAFFAIYKRGMLTKMFSLQASIPAGELQNQLEKTADAVIKRLETQIAHLEFLLDEADNKIAELDGKLQLANKALTERSLPPEPSLSFDYRLPPEAPDDISVIASTNANVELKQDSASKDSANNDKRRLVIAMAEQGYSVTEIAKSTGLGKGEILLFMQLNRK